MESLKSRTNTKWLLCCGPVAALLFVTTFSIEGALRPHYEASRYPVSSLSLESHGYVQVLNFLISGLLFILFSFGIQKQILVLKSSKKIANLVMLAGAGLSGAGIFSTDPVFGYPEYLPLRMAQFTFTGHMHDLVSLLVFICIPWACFVARKNFKEAGDYFMSAYSLVTSVVVLLTFILAGAGFKQAPYLVEFAGVLQRSSIISGCLWLAVLGIYLLRKNLKRSSSASPSLRARAMARRGADEG